MGQKSSKAIEPSPQASLFDLVLSDAQDEEAPQTEPEFDGASIDATDDVPPTSADDSTPSDSLEVSMPVSGADGIAPSGDSEEQTQHGLFGDGEWWEDEWKGMPEFIQNDLEPFKTVYVHFESKKDMDAFAKLLGQTITMQTRSMWYPEAEFLSKLSRRYVQSPKQTDEK